MFRPRKAPVHIAKKNVNDPAFTRAFRLSGTGNQNKTSARQTTKHSRLEFTTRLSTRNPSSTGYFAPVGVPSARLATARVSATTKETDMKPLLPVEIAG